MVCEVSYFFNKIVVYFEVLGFVLVLCFRYLV